MMKSKISIEVNFDENNLPVIQVLHQESDDVRDKLISSFLQSFKHTSRWCKILYMGVENVSHQSGDYLVNRWHIIPIKVGEIKEEMELMEATIENRK